MVFPRSPRTGIGAESAARSRKISIRPAFQVKPVPTTGAVVHLRTGQLAQRSRLHASHHGRRYGRLLEAGKPVRVDLAPKRFGSTRCIGGVWRKSTGHERTGFARA